VATERPFALGVVGDARVVLTRTGRVLRALPRGAPMPELPRVRLQLGEAPAAGTRLAGRDLRVRLAALRALPRGFRGRVLRADIDRRRALTLRLQSNLEIRLGPPTDLRRKLRAASLLLAHYPTVGDRAALRYLDVSASEHPVACPVGGDPNTQDVETLDPGAITTPVEQLSGAALAAACLQPASTTDSTSTATDATVTPDGEVAAASAAAASTSSDPTTTATSTTP
jgi:hypothetical protein